MRRIIFLFSIFFAVECKDLGNFGETFDVKERNLLEHIQTRLFQMQQDGSLETESDKINEKILSNVRSPQTVAGIKNTETERTFEYDPTIELTQDLTDHNGRVFAKKGDRFNPLEVMRLSKPLLFIDGDDEKQVKWAIAKLEDKDIQGHSSAKIILVKGSPLDLQKRLTDVDNMTYADQSKQLQQMPALQALYFDQHGVITSKLGIQQVPAILYQKKGKKVLTIREEKTAAVKGKK